jgi:hypothetical protein
MLFSRPVRRFLAVLFAAVLLLCQSLAFANACITGTPQDDSTTAPCHESGDPSKAPSQDNCHHASPASGFSIDLLAVTDLLPSLIEIVLPEAQWISAFLESPQLCFEPPPLRLVLCCLRN